jgi:hypothetical protein
MSITLTTGTNVVINSVQVENDTQGALIGIQYDFGANTATFQLAGGLVGTGAAFSIGQYAPRIQVVISLASGVWTSTSGQSGTLGGAGLTTLQTAALNQRNAFETFSVNQSIMPGTQVAWTVA